MYWYINKDGQTHGPFTETQILAWLANGQLPINAMLCPAGHQQWRPLANWPNFAQAIPRTPAPAPPTAPSTQHWPQPVNPSVSAYAGGTQTGRYSPEILQLASAHKQFTVGIGVILVLYFLIFNTLTSNNLWVLGLLLFVIKSGLTFFLTLKLATALRSGAATFWLIFSLIPIVGELALLVLSRQATNQLTAAGISVGFFGPKLPTN